MYTSHIICTQKELASQYSGNKLEEIMATGDGLLRVMDSAVVSYCVGIFETFLGASL